MPETIFRKGTTRFAYFEEPIGSGHNVLVVKTPKLYSHDFSGERSKFGTRSICVEVPEEIKDRLLNDGWRVTVSVPKDDRYEPRYFLPVTISYKVRAPRITKTAPNTPVEYDESTVDTLDSVSMTNIQLVINPFKDKKRPDAQTTAYLREMQFELTRSPLDYFDDEDEEEEIPNF